EFKSSTWTLLLNADPDSPVSSTRQTHDPRFDRVHLRDAALVPVDESRLPTQPKASVTVSKYGIGTGNRDSIILSETPDGALSNVAEGLV
ncbi:MAG: hypothetical protein WB555_17900, partial [Candidatus Korobacteraceae bacterium]